MEYACAKKTAIYANIFTLNSNSIEQVSNLRISWDAKEEPQLRKGWMSSHHKSPGCSQPPARCPVARSGIFPGKNALVATRFAPCPAPAGSVSLRSTPESWSRAVVVSCYHERSSYRRLPPHLQRAHAGRTQGAAPDAGKRCR